MDFSLTEEQRALQDTVRRFAAGELVEAAREVEERDEPPGPAVRRRFAELGLLGVNLDPAYGGAGINRDLGTPHNPWNQIPHVPGGSSSGSAVAVAAGMTPAARTLPRPRGRREPRR